MTTLTLELSTDIYQLLSQEATRVGKSLQLIIQEWITERLIQKQPAQNEPECVRQALRAAGLLTIPGPVFSQMATAAGSLEQVRAVLNRMGGQPLSEIVLEQRGSKGCQRGC